MNIIATAIITGAITTLPSPSLPTNPIDGLSISAAGISMELSGTGLDTHRANSTDFEFELRLKSAPSIRVRL